jgi:hypothetical protein
MAATPETPVREEPAATASPLDRHASPVSDHGRSNGRAVAALVLGIISIPTFFFWPVSIVTGILAIVLGSIAKTDIRKGRYTNAGQAKAGIICGIVGLVLMVGFIVVVGVASS